MVRALWWKIPGPILVLYSLIAGLSIPLGPGIYSTDPVTLTPKTTNTVYVQGFNITFDKTPVAWIKNGKQSVCLENIEVQENKSSFKATLNTTGLIPDKGLHLVVHEEGKGSLAMENAFIITGEQGGKESGLTCAAVVEFQEPAGTYFPFQPLLYESIRNLLFHVPMWFAMILTLLFSAGHSIAYLRTGKIDHDTRANALAVMGVIFGALGLFTGMVWAKNTWGSPWTSDPKLNGSAISMLMYLAYLILRAAIDDEEKRARVAAVANVFFMPMFIVLIFVLPRITDSLHPGNGGNPGFNSYDLDNTMRMVFYPAVLGWMLIGLWTASIIYRIKKLSHAE